MILDYYTATNSGCFQVKDIDQAQRIANEFDVAARFELYDGGELVATIQPEPVPGWCIIHL